MKCCLKTENSCLKTQIKHPLVLFVFFFFYSKKFEDEMYEDRIRTEDRLVKEFKVLEYHTNCKVTIYIYIYIFF